MRTDRSVLNTPAFRILFCVLALLTAMAGCRSPRHASADFPATPRIDSGGASGEATTAQDAPPGLASRPERLTVAEAVAEALSCNRSVMQANIGTAIGETYADEARSLLYPRLDAVGKYTRRNSAPQAVAPELGTSFSVGPREVLGLDVVASYSIYGFGRHLHAYRSAQLDQRRLEADAQAVESDIGAAVTAAAFDLLEGIRAIDVTRDNEEALLQQVKDAKALLDAGRVTRADLLEAEVEYENTVRTREKLESAVPILRIRLNVLLGRPTDTPTEIIDEPSAAPLLWTEAEVEADALTLRPELNSARLDVEARDRAYHAAVGRELPELLGTLTYTTTNSPFTSPSDAIILGISLDLPIFTAGGRGARIRRARREVDLARLRKADAEAAVRTEVAEAFRNATESYRDIGVARRAIEKAEESLRIQREKFTSGRATSREVLDSTALLSRSRYDHLRALFNYNVALRALHRARGAPPLEFSLTAGPGAETGDRTPEADASAPGSQGGK